MIEASASRTASASSSALDGPAGHQRLCQLGLVHELSEAATPRGVRRIVENEQAYVGEVLIPSVYLASRRTSRSSGS